MNRIRTGESAVDNIDVTFWKHVSFGGHVCLKDQQDKRKLLLAGSEVYSVVVQWQCNGGAMVVQWWCNGGAMVSCTAQGNRISCHSHTIAEL